MDQITSIMIALNHPKLIPSQVNFIKSEIKRTKEILDRVKNDGYSGKQSIELRNLLYLMYIEIGNSLDSYVKNGLNCNDKSLQIVTDTGICQFCNNSFVRKSKKRKFCSNKCKMKYFLLKKRVLRSKLNILSL